MHIHSMPRKVFRGLAGIIGFLLLANVAAHCFWAYTDIGILHWVGSLFNVNNEHNFPSAFSAANLLLASGLLLVVGRNAEDSTASARFWLLLSFVFLFLSIDEFVQVHEMLVGPTQRLMGSDEGVLRFAWVLPYGALLAIFGAIIFREYWRLASRTRMLFTVAGALFVFGAVGFEAMGGVYLEEGSSKSLVLMMLTMTEEGLEMFGIALFNYALLDLIATRLGGLRFSLDADPVAETRSATSPRHAVSAVR